MNTEQMKSNLTTAYMMFIFDFADPSSIDKEKLTGKLSVPLTDLFKAQRPLDKAKKDLGPDQFAQLLSLYFNQFMKSDGVQSDEILKIVKEHEKIFVRHIGKDKLNYLRLISTLFQGLAEVPKAQVNQAKKRGLLLEAS